MFAIIFAILFIAIASVVPHLRRMSVQWQKLHNVPCLPQYPLVGNALMFLNKKPEEILQILWDTQRQLGKVVKYNLMDSVMVIVSDPKVAQGILSSQKLISKSYEYEFLKNWLGDGLLLSKGKKWFSRRHTITPTFHFKILEQFVETFDKQSSTLAEILAKNKPTDSVDIYPLVTLAALDVICESAMGASINAQTNSESEYVNAVKEIANIIHIRMFNPRSRNHLLFKLSSQHKKEKEALKILHKFTDSVILSRRNELLEELKDDKRAEQVNEDEDIGAKKKKALLDVLLQSTIDGKPLTNADIREEVDTFMFEGHDTTTSGVAFALYNIAKHPEVQKKLMEEIAEVIGEDKTRPVTLQMLNDLSYLDATLKESMRLFPPVPMMARTITEETEINGIVFPVNSGVTVQVLFMNRDADFFPDPDSFKPERFQGTRTSETLNPYTYVPFSAGPRNCIGQKFAVLEMKSMVSKVLRHFEISVDPSYGEPVIIAELILRPINGLHLNFKPRD